MLRQTRDLNYLPSTFGEVQCSETSWGNSLRGVGLEDSTSSTSLGYGQKAKVRDWKQKQQTAVDSEKGSVSYL